jgi:ribosome recycling factor
LLKKHSSLTDEQRKQIFTEDRKITEKEKKRVLAMKRDKKVEELKKTLTKDNDLPTLASRKEHMTHLMPETISTCEYNLVIIDFFQTFYE